MGEAGTAASASTSTYGSIDQRPSGEVSAARQTRAKQSVMSKAAPFIVLAVLGVMSVLVSFLGKADRQIDQDLFAFEQDNLYNKHIVWTGEKWVDEKSGSPVSMAAQQTQSLMQTEAHPTYDCCYVPETNLRNGAVKIAGTNRRVMPGMFCHMMVKGLPSSKWPMIRMGSLREAGVASVPGLGAGMLAKHQLHHCRNDIIFKTQHVARLLSLEPASI